MSTFQATILAAGQGTRIKSKKIKIMHEVCGRPIIEWVVSCALDAGATRVVPILGYQKELVAEHLVHVFGDRIAIAEQTEQLGTGHAVFSALEQLEGYEETTVVLSGDVPNLRPGTLAAFLSACHGKPGLITAVLEDAKHYGRIIREHDIVNRIVEYKDASPTEREIKEINAGFYAFETAALGTALRELLASEPSNAQGEYYLTDLVETLGPCVGWILDDHTEMAGVNTRVDLAEAVGIARDRINRFWMMSGVTMLNPETVHIDAEAKIGQDVLIHGNVEILGPSRIGADTIVQSGSVIENTRIGERVTIKPCCHLESSSVDDESQIGPFAHLRPDADIGKGCKVGNFVEVKKVRMDDGSKANHHAYLGDGHVGKKANIGAGTIFCNYDGKNKHFTDIGEGVFIGSNSALVAPLKIEAGAYVGAGSTITNDVPKDALAVARGKQRNIEGWARRKNGE